MANERPAQVVAHLVGLAAGLVGGFFLGRPAADGRSTPMPRASVGRLYRVDSETYIDGAFIEFLRPRINAHPSASGDWTIFGFRNFGLFVQSLSEASLLPGQHGPLYMVRHVLGDTSQATNDSEAHALLQDLVDLGLLEFGGVFRSWGEVVHGVNNGV